MDECFVIMPISMPGHLVETYGDQDHFLDVYKYLFKPAIEQAGLKPVPPVAKGAVLIQADIIERIEKVPLVLCDMSILNPNAFFELGIRTALNKPVCMVKDTETPNVPFDNQVINHQTYRCKLTTKELETEIPKLAEHINDSFKTSNGGNAMWKYFGLSTAARPAEVAEGADAKIDYVIKLLESQRQTENRAAHAPDSGPATDDEVDDVIWNLQIVADKYGVRFSSWTFNSDPRIITILTWDGDLTKHLTSRLAPQAKKLGWRLRFSIDGKDF